MIPYDGIIDGIMDFRSIENPKEEAPETPTDGDWSPDDPQPLPHAWVAGGIRLVLRASAEIDVERDIINDTTVARYQYERFRLLDIENTFGSRSENIDDSQSRSFDLTARFSSLQNLVATILHLPYGQFSALDRTMAPYIIHYEHLKPKTNFWTFIKLSGVRVHDPIVNCNSFMRMAQLGNRLDSINISKDSYALFPTHAMSKGNILQEKRIRIDALLACNRCLAYLSLSNALCFAHVQACESYLIAGYWFLIKRDDFHTSLSLVHASLFCYLQGVCWNVISSNQGCIIGGVPRGAPLAFAHGVLRGAPWPLSIFFIDNQLHLSFDRGIDCIDCIPIQLLLFANDVSPSWMHRAAVDCSALQALAYYVCVDLSVNVRVTPLLRGIYLKCIEIDQLFLFAGIAMLAIADYDSSRCLCGISLTHCIWTGEVLACYALATDWKYRAKDTLRMRYLLFVDAIRFLILFYQCYSNLASFHMEMNADHSIMWLHSLLWIRFWSLRDPWRWSWYIYHISCITSCTLAYDVSVRVGKGDGNWFLISSPHNVTTFSHLFHNCAAICLASTVRMYRMLGLDYYCYDNALLRACSARNVFEFRLNGGSLMDFLLMNCHVGPPSPQFASVAGRTSDQTKSEEHDTIHGITHGITNASIPANDFSPRQAFQASTIEDVASGVVCTPLPHDFIADHGSFDEYFCQNFMYDVINMIFKDVNWSTIAATYFMIYLADVMNVLSERARRAINFAGFGVSYEAYTSLNLRLFQVGCR